ncbi:MAG: integration host factor subunit beta [Treponema sp.]|nr:integration host factor subunit beta [Treponema sp.]
MVVKKRTKYDIIEDIYKKTDFDRQTISSVVDAFLSEMRKSLEDGANIEFRGFGTFELRLRKGRKEARNPKTGEKLSGVPHYVAAFRAGRDLRNNIFNLPVKTDDEK